MSHLFDPLQIRGLTLANRLWVSPMCQYAADKNGVVGEWHLVSLGAFATGGTGLIMAESTAVVSEGRITNGCPGIWNKVQIDPWRRIIDFVHSQGTKIGIQLVHSGRKGSRAVPDVNFNSPSIEIGGWQTMAPSQIAYDDYPEPRALTILEIQQIVKSWGQAACRAVDAGFDLIEVHAAHGYLLHQFYSPLTNKRSDQYGGTFENRIRFLKEVVTEVRSSIPDQMPLFVRISATEWSEGGWGIDDSVELSIQLAALGVDLIDVSSGWNIPQQNMASGPGFQVPFSKKIKSTGKVMTSAVGMINHPNQAEEIIFSGGADAVMVGREMLRNPRWPLHAAEVLGQEVRWPLPIERGRS